VSFQETLDGQLLTVPGKQEKFVCIRIW